MRKRRASVLLVVGCVAGLAILYFTRTAGDDGSGDGTAPSAGSNVVGSAIPQGKTPSEVELARIYDTKFSFYGEVLDSVSGDPIPSAAVAVAITVKPDVPAVEKRFVVTTDAQGRFSIENERGGSISLRPSKEGYAQLQDLSKRSAHTFTTWNNAGRPNVSSTSPESPATLYLRKVEASRPAKHHPRKKFENSELSGVRSVNLIDGSSVKISHSTDFDAANPRNGWPWSAKLEFLGMAVSARESKDQYLAPIDGYETFVEVGFPDEGQTPPWRSSFSGDYFFKTDAGIYGRIDFRLVGRDGDFIVEIWEAQPGSRNAESL